MKRTASAAGASKEEEVRAVQTKRAKADEAGPGEWQGGVLSKRRIVNRWKYLPDGAIEMQLNHGATTIFDAEDLDIVTQHKWHLMTRSGYAHSSFGTGLYMHRFLMQTPKHLHTDHIDRDKLNNRRSNLRKVSRTENQRNMNGLKRNTSGQHGIDEVRCFYFSFMEGEKSRKVVVSYSLLKRGSSLEKMIVLQPGELPFQVLIQQNPGTIESVLMYLQRPLSPQFSFIRELRIYASRSLTSDPFKLGQTIPIVSIGSSMETA